LSIDSASLVEEIGDGSGAVPDVEGRKVGSDPR
jgi:hypothetical protein